MPERIYKLQPNRTMQLRGFDSLGASAALHSATASSFKVSGTFRDAADFAVVTLYDADNFYDHPRIRYLPDFDFDGLSLTFDVRYAELMPLDSPKFPTIDWPFLNVIRANGVPAQIRLFDYATQVGGTYTKATSTVTIGGTGIRQFDRITLFYLKDYAFDYVVPKTDCSFTFVGAGAATVHFIQVGAARYETTELAEDTNTAIAARLQALVTASPRVTATVVGGNQIDLRNKATDGAAYIVTSSAPGGPHTLNAVGTAWIAQRLAQQINAANYTNALLGLNATVVGSTINLESSRAGVDGNGLAIYTASNNGRITATPAQIGFSGGSSDATWRIALNFAALGIAQIRLMWLTFAPPLRIGTPIPTLEWQATFTNWTLSGPEAKRTLQVAAPGSVRVEETSSWCKFTGTWQSEEGFYSGGYSKRAAAGSTVLVKYACASTHNLYIGTSLYSDRATAGVKLDGDAETDLVCALAATEQVNTRRLVRANVPAGEHNVLLTVKGTGFFYFDFLEAAVLGDVPDALPAIATMSPALDYSTDHTFKRHPRGSSGTSTSWVSPDR